MNVVASLAEMVVNVLMESMVTPVTVVLDGLELTVKFVSNIDQILRFELKRKSISIIY